jgi:hypothetical protein
MSNDTAWGKSTISQIEPLLVDVTAKAQEVLAAAKAKGSFTTTQAEAISKLHMSLGVVSSDISNLKARLSAGGRRKTRRNRN